MALLDIFGVPPGYAGLLSPEEEQRARQQAQMQGLLGLASGFFEAAEPSPVRRGIGASAIRGLMAGQQMAGETYNQAIKGQIVKQQLDELKNKQVKDAVVKAAMPNLFRTDVVTPGQFGRGLSMEDPVARQLATQNAELAGEQGLSMLEASANYPVQGTPQAETLRMPETRTALNPQTLSYLRSVLPTKDYRDLIAGAKEELELTQPKPEYLTVGQSVYVKDPTAKNGLRLAIDNSGNLTGEYANLANLFYKTTDPRKLSPEAVNNIIAQVNKKAALEGGGGLDVGKTGLGEVDKSLLSSGARLITLNRITQGFDPRFLETKFRTSMLIRSTGEKLGRDLTTTERDELSAYSKFRQDAVRQLNQYINEATGAAIGQGEEAARLKSGVPNPGSGLFDGDSPTEFKAKLENTIRDLKMAEARLHYIKVNGLKIGDVSLARMPQIMKDREQDLIKQFKLDPNRPEDRNVLRNRLAQEFGLLQ